MTKLRIVITDSTFPNADIERKELAPLDAELITAQCKTEDDVLAVTRDADALMVQWAPITRRVIEGLKHCQFISRYGVGVDMIDLNAAKDHGIKASASGVTAKTSSSVRHCAMVISASRGASSFSSTSASGNAESVITI